MNNSNYIEIIITITILISIIYIGFLICHFFNYKKKLAYLQNSNINFWNNELKIKILNEIINEVGVNKKNRLINDKHTYLDLLVIANKINDENENIIFDIINDKTVQCKETINTIFGEIKLDLEINNKEINVLALKTVLNQFLPFFITAWILSIIIQCFFYYETTKFSEGNKELNIVYINSGYFNGSNKLLNKSKKIDSNYYSIISDNYKGLFHLDSIYKFKIHSSRFKALKFDYSKVTTQILPYRLTNNNKVNQNYGYRMIDTLSLNNSFDKVIIESSFVLKEFIWGQVYDFIKSLLNYGMGFSLIVSFFPLVFITQARNSEELKILSNVQNNKYLLFYIILTIISFELLVRFHSIWFPWKSINILDLVVNISGLICSLGLFLYAGRLDSKQLLVEKLPIFNIESNISKPFIKLTGIIFIAIYAICQNTWFILPKNIYTSNEIIFLIFLCALLGKITILHIFHFLLKSNLLILYLKNTRKVLIELENKKLRYDKYNIFHYYLNTGNHKIQNVELNSMLITNLICDLNESVNFVAKTYDALLIDNMILICCEIKSPNMLEELYDLLKKHFVHFNRNIEVLVTSESSNKVLSLIKFVKKECVGEFQII